MPRHRFAEILEATEPAVATAVNPAAFVLCPLLGMGGGPMASVWQQVYHLAYEQAKAVVAPSRLERLLTPSLN